MRQSEEDGVRGAPSVHRNKTFVLRGFNGVPVQGHRAVVTHSPDGVIHRALVRWPALAPSGHALRTSLTTAQISLRAIQALEAEGEPAPLLMWALAEELAVLRDMPQTPGYVQLALRLGYGSDLAPTPRRPLSEVLLAAPP